MVPMAQNMTAAPDKVSAVVETALTAKRPRARYVVGAVPKIQASLVPKLPSVIRVRALRKMAGQP